jgi:hypothetical protein
MRPDELNRDGVYLLAAALIESCISRGSLRDALVFHRPRILDAAFDWAVMCGCDPHIAAQAIARRAAESYIAADTEPPAPAEMLHDWHYSHGKRCRCGRPITNKARTCRHCKPRGEYRRVT